MAAQQQGGARLLGVRAARGGRAAHQNGYIQMFETPNVTVRMSADHSVLNPTQTSAESESSESAAAGTEWGERRGRRAGGVASAYR